ncbi:MAG: AAA family ATPase [Chloroflexi bacterium]|nr:AAA family ATPase [Chloroflexota bacterium]
MDLRAFEVPVASLRWRCDPKQFDFKCTDELRSTVREFIGQERAISAIEFGLGVNQPGYNIYVAGMPGTGRSTIIKAHLEEVVRQKQERGDAPKPKDWCYIFNFADPDRPKIIGLPAGLGRQFKQGLEALYEHLRQSVAQAFSGEEYGNQRKAIGERNQEAQRLLFQQLDQEARKLGLIVQFSPMGVVVAPMKDGRAATQEEFQALPERTREQVEQRREAVLKRVETMLEQARAMDLQARLALVELDKRVAEFATKGPFDNAAKAFAEQADITEFLKELHTFAVEHIAIFRPLQEEPGQDNADGVRLLRERQMIQPFVVNVFVDNSHSGGPPIVLENNPTFSNLFGKIDRRFVMGAYVTDHTMLKAGAVHRANGGYLVVPMRQVLMNPLSWEALKRAIKDQRARPEDPTEVMGLVAPQTLRPEPMPLDIKVVATGDTTIYNLLAAYDEDFWQTFKVKADFDYQITRTPEHLNAYANYICRSCDDNNLLHFDPPAVAKVIEYAARTVDDQRKLSTRFGYVRDLLIEADFCARKDGATVVAARHVEKALEQKVFRSNLIAERITELIADGTFMVDVSGAVAGQVNGLAVYDVGDFAFGRPSRITARTFLGRGGVINIEREAKMSGRTHDKGVLILSGFLGSTYAQEQPLSVTASIAFEQSYEGIDGDSASSTEIYAILSSLSDVPIKQNIAVTGSVNQKGEVQAIGGVNQKIEGYYDVCRAIGLTGDQGVMIPKQNVQNLMLREDVVQAVAAGRFHIYSVGSIAEGLEILTGVEFGRRGADGKYPEDSINAKAMSRLREFAKAQRLAAKTGGQSADGQPARDEEA